MPFSPEAAAIFFVLGLLALVSILGLRSRR